MCMDMSLDSILHNLATCFLFERGMRTYFKLIANYLCSENITNIGHFGGFQDGQPKENPYVLAKAAKLRKIPTFWP